MLPSSLAFWFAVTSTIAVALALAVRRLPGRRAPPAAASRGGPAVLLAGAHPVDSDRGREGSPAPSGRPAGDATAPPGDVRRGSPRVRRAAIAIGLALPLIAALVLGFGRNATSPPAPLDLPSAGADGAFRTQLTAHLASAPRDGRAWVTLARLEMDADRFHAASAAYAKAIAATPKIGRDPTVLCEYADALGMTLGGRLDGAPAEWIERALAIDPAHPKALEMAGSLAYERRDFRTAVRHWRALLDQIEAGSPAHAELSAAIQRAERLASTALPPASAPPAAGG